MELTKAVNPKWQDWAEGWGEKTEPQIPRSARDDNKSCEPTFRVGDGITKSKF